MNITIPHRRQAGRALCAAASAFSAAMLLLSASILLTSQPVTAGAASSGGSPTIAPASGGSGAEFALTLPAGAACTGDTANGNYRVQTYIVPSSVDPATLTFNSTGPIALGTGANLRQPLYGTDTVPFVNQGTNVSATPGGPGLVSGLPSFSFAVFGPSVVGVIPPGVYNLGVACTLGVAGPSQLDKFWNLQLTFTASGTDPGGVTWAFPQGGTTTTTGGSTTTTSGGSTTTTSDGSTTTTTTGDTTTTADGGTTTTTAAADVSGSDLFSGGSPSAASPVTTAGQLPYTGNSPLPLVFWAVCLLVFGRAAMLLGKRPKVIDDGPRG